MLAIIGKAAEVSAASTVAEPGRDPRLCRCISTSAGNPSGHHEHTVIADYGSSGAAGHGDLLLQGDDEIKGSRSQKSLANQCRPPTRCPDRQHALVSRRRSPSVWPWVASRTHGHPPRSPAIRCSAGS